MKGNRDRNAVADSLLVLMQVNRRLLYDWCGASGRMSKFFLLFRFPPSFFCSLIRFFFSWFIVCRLVLTLNSKPGLYSALEIF